MCFIESFSQIRATIICPSSHVIFGTRILPRWISRCKCLFGAERVSHAFALLHSEEYHLKLKSEAIRWESTGNQHFMSTLDTSEPWNMIKQKHGLILQSTRTSMSVRTMHSNAAKGSLVRQMEKSLKQTITIISLCTEFFTGDKSSKRELLQHRDHTYQQNREVKVTPSNLLQPPTTSANTLQDGCLHHFPLREILTDDFNFQLSIAVANFTRFN